MIRSILAKMGYPPNSYTAEQLRSEEDGAPYNVWKLRFSSQTMILKEAKGDELAAYRAFFTDPCAYAPRLYGTHREYGKDYLLMEFIPGEAMMKCSRENLKLALDSLIAMQRAYWDSTDDFGFENAFSGRKNRGNYLNSPELESVYGEFLDEFASLPRTLCHDDLLPFNVICGKDRAVFIDWEVCGILPYPVSLARLIAHGEAGEGAFFFLSEADKSFALDYYYDNFIASKGISRETYDRTMGLFLFYEYCEWIYLGNKYPDADMDRFHSYSAKAAALIRRFQG